MKRITTYILLLAVAVLGVTFSCLNAQYVNVNYYVNTATLPLSLLLVLTFVLGGLMALLFSANVLMRCKRQQHRLTQQLHALQNKDSA